MEREEILFRTLEKHLLGEQLQQLTAKGDAEPDAFIKLVQSALQRRKSRAGSALENHLEQVFGDLGISYTRTGVTENRLKPDFIFPSIPHYADPTFPADRLTMLAAKSTCKDRWRQILNEAARIPRKHLLTLEPSISTNQTNEMALEQVQLVIPAPLFPTYSDVQQRWLLNVRGFAELVHARQ
nr:type II restriction endonuclease [Brevundimonas sp. EYE_349]